MNECVRQRRCHATFKELLPDDQLGCGNDQAFIFDLPRQQEHPRICFPGRTVPK